MEEPRLRVGPAKRTAVMLTCTGTNPNYLKKWTTA